MTEPSLAAWIEEAEYAFASALADMDGDIEAFRELSVIYGEELPNQVALIAGAGHDAARLLPLLHEAANTLGVVGARLYSRKIRDVEEDLRNGQPCDLPQAARTTIAAMERTGVALERWLQARSG